MSERWLEIIPSFFCFFPFFLWVDPRLRMRGPNDNSNGAAQRSCSPPPAALRPRFKPSPSACRCSPPVRQGAASTPNVQRPRPRRWPLTLHTGALCAEGVPPKGTQGSAAQPLHLGNNRGNSIPSRPRWSLPQSLNRSEPNLMFLYLPSWLHSSCYYRASLTRW